MTERPYIDQRRIWGILVNHAGAPDDDWTWVQFRQWWDGPWNNEFRFQGVLGFGGKFWRDRDGIRVNCYREDETPERLAVIQKTNEALATVQAMFDTTPEARSEPKATSSNPNPDSGKQPSGESESAS